MYLLRKETDLVQVRILYVITSLDVGGAERQVMDIARRMAKDHDVCICYLTGEQALSTQGAPIQVEALGMRKGIGSFFSGYFKLRLLVRKFRPDVVHSHMVHANILARLVRLSLRFPVLVCSAHSTFEGGRLRMLAYRLTDCFADLTTNVSHDAVKAFEAQGAVRKDSMRVVHNGIDTDLFRFDPKARAQIRLEHGVKDSDTLILAVGRLVAAKDYPNLLAAYSLLKKGGVSARLWIVGEGCERKDLDKLTKKLELQHDVSFMGIRHDIALLYNAADLYVLSSAWEGLPLVVAEAMATERLVVATDCGGVRQLVGANAVLVPPGNPELLALGIGRALELSPEEKTSLGTKARSRIIEEFSLRSTVAAWQMIYTNLCADH